MSVSIDDSSPDLALGTKEKHVHCQEVVEMDRSQSLAEFYTYFGSNLPQAFRVDKSSNEHIEDVREGEVMHAPR